MSTKQLLIITSLISCLILFWACEQSDSQKNGDYLQFSLKNYQGEVVDLSKSSGQVTLLVFWATWCQPCLAEIPSLMALQERYKNRNLQVIGINVDDPEGARVADITRAYGINYPILVGNEAIMKRFGGINSLPTSFIIGKDGKVKEKLMGLYPEHLIEQKLLAVMDPA